MLNRLTINDVVLIDRMALELQPGLNVFTGETGAGKSILLDALGLALGGRGDASIIRHGAAQASISAEYTLQPEHAVFALAEEQGLALDNPVILRRVANRDGKSRAFINDQPVSIGLLRQFGEQLLEIHGQFDTHGLLDPASHRGLLDAFGNNAELIEKTAAAFGVWHTAEEKQKATLAERERAAAEEDFLRSAVAELTDLAPEVGEAEKLAIRRSGLQHREKIQEALQAADASLNSDRGAVAALAQAGKYIARVSDKSQLLPPLLAAIDRAANEVADACQKLDHIIGSLDAEPDTLQRIEERLFSLRGMARKHNVQVDDLPALCDTLAQRLALITNQGDILSALTREAAQAKATYKKLAEKLSIKRCNDAILLEKAVMRELPPLKLERARFKIDIIPLPEEQWSALGADRITFLAATNPGTEPAALQKIASGGELARFMLALKVILAASDPVPTLVFDEVDTGIGGATASAVGERLARLAEHVQVLVVTHSPQVAARGNNHLRVAKRMKSGQAVTDVETLDIAARREEIARMLAGSQITNAAREAAQSLLEDAGIIEPPKAPKRAKA